YAYGSVETIELDLRTPVAHARAGKAVALVYELSVAALRGRVRHREVRHGKVAVDFPVEGLHLKIGREVGLEVEIDVAVERAEIGRGCRVLAEEHLQAAVQRVGVAGAGDLQHLDAAVDVVDVISSGDVLDFDPAVVDGLQHQIRIMRHSQ